MTGKILILLVRFYQYFVSPLKVPTCRFYPSCSCYAVEAIRLHGPCTGTMMTLGRLSRCHPWHPGGYDPVRPAAERLEN